MYKEGMYTECAQRRGIKLRKSMGHNIMPETTRGLEDKLAPLDSDWGKQVLSFVK